MRNSLANRCIANRRIANRRIASWRVVTLTAFAFGCAPAIRPLPGTPVPAMLPSTQLPARPLQLPFTWTYSDETFSANGDGVVRIAGPSRARLDFFLRNGSAGGYAILIGDSLFVPGPDVARRLVPPPPMLWAALGTLAIPATRDTVARRDGDTLRADLGTLPGGDARKAQGTAWRIAFSGNRIARLEHIEGGRRVEVMTRRGTNGDSIGYNHETARRRLTIVIGDTTWVQGFDDAIWRRN